MQEKRLYLVIKLIMEDGQVISNMSTIMTSDSEARENIRLFAERQNAGQKTSLYPNRYSLFGKMKLKDETTGEYSDHDTKTWYAHYEPVDIDEDDIEDSKREWTVDVEVIKTFNFSVCVEASDEYDAKEQARENIDDGDHDYEMGCNDAIDTEIDVNDAYES